MFRHLASLLLFICLMGLAIGSSDSGSGRESSNSGSTTTSTQPVGAGGGSSNSGSTTTSTQPVGGDDGSKRISGDHRIGCSDRDYLDKLAGYAAEKDEKAFSQGLAAGLLSGVCTMFKEGEEVYLADTAIFSGLVKVRRKGETQEYWTNLEAVK
jgi:hypothetical protein